MAALCLARGTSVIQERVFESRFLHVSELKRMGCQIELQGDTAIITGVEHLPGAEVRATDLRAGAALVETWEDVAAELPPPWRDVLLASLVIQLIGLATPLFTQVVIDKESYEKWLKQGATPSDTVRALYGKLGA